MTKASAQTGAEESGESDSGDLAALDQRTFRRVMGRFSTGVAVVTFLRDGEPAGITVNSFLSVSADPPLILVSLRRESSVIHHLGVGDCYGVSFLTEEQLDIGLHFSGKPIEDLDVAYEEKDGTPLIRGSLAQVIGRVVDVHEAGDHFLYIAGVEHLWQGPESKPLIFYSGRYKQIHAHEPGRHFSDELQGW
ncbi:flavin reductase family protein [Dokdonella sp.]|uniref:flavin reductase family protein n=1 Tax=Dokdonella sp. TaxID=2291710 RepID=UPI003529BCA8